MASGGEVTALRNREGITFHSRSGKWKACITRRWWLASGSEDATEAATEGPAMEGRLGAGAGLHARRHIPR